MLIEWLIAALLSIVVGGGVGAGVAVLLTRKLKAQGTPQQPVPPGGFGPNPYQQ